MKREIMSTKRYDEVLDLLETNANAMEELTEGEKQEIFHDGYAMAIAAATNVKNLQYLPKQLRQDKTFMRGLIKDVNPLAMAYCYKSWFKNSNFVDFVREAAKRDCQFRQNGQELMQRYNQLIDMQVQKANQISEDKAANRASNLRQSKQHEVER